MIDLFQVCNAQAKLAGSGNMMISASATFSSNNESVTGPDSCTNTSPNPRSRARSLSSKMSDIARGSGARKIRFGVLLLGMMLLAEAAGLGSADVKTMDMRGVPIKEAMFDYEAFWKNQMPKEPS